MMNLDYFYIPPLPESLINCLAYMHKDEFDYDGLIKKITNDVGVTEKIFTVANSQVYGKGSYTSNLKQALLRIGTVNLLDILTTEYYKKSFKNVDIDFFNLRDFNRHSSYVSKVAVALGEISHIEDINDLMIAGLFHDIGLMARSYCQHQLMQEIINKCKSNKMDFYSTEKFEKIPNHEEFGKKVAQKWNLNERITFLIEHHHTPEGQIPSNLEPSLRKELDILCLADTLAHSMQCGFKNYFRDTKVSKNSLEKMGLSIEAVAQTTKEVFHVVEVLPS